MVNDQDEINRKWASGVGPSKEAMNATIDWTPKRRTDFDALLADAEKRSMTKKMAVLRLDHQALLKLLHLPEDVEVVGIRTNPNERGGPVFITVEGVGCDVRMGDPYPYPRAGIVYTGHEGGKTTILRVDWGLPK